MYTENVNPLARLDPNYTENKCRGLYWRGTVSSYLSSHRSIEVRKSLRLLKKRSCKGCPVCEFFHEYIAEDILMDSFDYVGEIENGAIYTYKIHSSKGYYDLYPEIDYVEFFKVKS